jgi:hypothetical protein
LVFWVVFLAYDGVVNSGASFLYFSKNDGRSDEAGEMMSRMSLGDCGNGGENEFEEFPDEREGVVAPRDEGLSALLMTNLGVPLPSFRPDVADVLSIEVTVSRVTVANIAALAAAAKPLLPTPAIPASPPLLVSGSCSGGRTVTG